MLFIFIPIIIFLLAISYYIRLLIYPKVYSHEEVLNYALDNEHFKEDFLESYQKESVVITSPYGYPLRGKIILNEQTEKFMIMCHGITSNYHGMKKYIKIFLDRGYSILLYDHRNHGISQRSFTTYGYYEKFDAKACVDMIITKYNPKTIGVFGESMGAAIAMQLVTIDSRIDFCIEDCGYSDAYRLFKYRSEHDHHKLVGIFTKPTNFFMKAIYKWSFEDVSVVNYINKASCPILFIHGEDDDYVPFYMVHDLYNAYQHKKAILTIKGAKHANSIVTDPKAYIAGVNDFLNTYHF